MAYSFDRLAITSGGRLYYCDGTTLVQVVDPDLGVALAVTWIDGYFMTTDGTYMVVTELIDPMSVNPLKYGSSEIDPDPIMAVLKLRNEIVAVNRYTIEYFNDVGGTLFPFQRVEGAQVQKGALGAHCACVFTDVVAFLGSGKNEPPAIYFGLNAVAVKISTSGIDQILNSYAEIDLATVILETHVHLSHPQLWIRLPDRTLVYDLDATQALKAPVWFQLTSAKIGFSAYRVVDPVWCYDEWTICDAVTGNFGILTSDSAHQFGDVVRWEFAAAQAYNDGHGVIWNQLELVCLTGRVADGEDPVISTSYSLDGETWSELRSIHAGMRGDRMRRLVWFKQGMMRNWRVQRFEGDSRARLSVIRLEVAMETLSA
jgi:Phage stabilisation protein.